MQRNDGRGYDEIRSINFELNIAPHANGSVLVSMGQTRVICGVTIEESVPRWMKEQVVTGGWLTAEYSMLPYSTQTRKPRDIAKGRLDGRSVEIQRLIGRSLRAVVDLEKLGPRTDLGRLRCLASRWRNTYDRNHRSQSCAGYCLPETCEG